jgi:hypothetical protein
LSTFGRVTADRGSVLPESTNARVSSAVSVAVRPFTYAAIRNAEAR